MVKRDVEIETVGEGVDEIDKLAELTDEMQLKNRFKNLVVSLELAPERHHRKVIFTRDVIVISKDYNLIESDVEKKLDVGLRA
ncbi:hypothetical protein Tco_0238272 [Tanacetum coccineum]